MFRSVSHLILLLAVCCQTTSLLAQRTVRVGVGVVPALNRTIDLGVEIGNGKNLEFFGQMGYSFGERKEKAFYESGGNGSRWFETSGGFLKIGGRITSNQARRWRIFAGSHLTTSLVYDQSGYITIGRCGIVNCTTLPSPIYTTNPTNRASLFSVGASTGVSVQVMKRLEVDLGVELNKILSGEERLLQPDAYKPGIGSTPFQALVNVQYRLK
jgi:hypothetical protein